YKDAKAMYMALGTSNRPFIFEHFYEILSTNPKWQQILNVSKEKTEKLDAYFEVMATNQEKSDAADIELMATINK
ncbi:hypothetical protein CU098_006295, partial [Rhizopus stolonifer]